MPKIIIIKVKEEYLMLVPRPTKEERMALKEDIMLHGQHDPIVINRNGFILDGYTRYEICQELGIEVKYRIQEFETQEEEKRYVINCNVRRRHLNAFQRVGLMYQMYVMEKELARKRHYGVENYDGIKKGNVGEIIGKTIGVNGLTVSKSVYIMEHATAEIQDKVRNGKLSIEKAYTDLKHTSYARILRKSYIKNDTKLICPRCQQVSKKKEWKKA